MCSCGIDPDCFTPIDDVIDVTLGTRIMQQGIIEGEPGQVTVRDGCGIGGGEQFMLYEIRDNNNITAGWYVERLAYDPDDFEEFDDED